ncbi:MAG: hypothetical protein GX246_03020 [Clostridiales bacterium]|jgi:hypothetical protein|nr:hypothetical protein [Bacillota bacterium]NLL54103.1 hypothetical protein [Clostridiales bacterium]
MKRFRPRCAGYYLLYGLVALSLGDALYTIIRQMMGKTDTYLQSFSLFTYLIAAFAIVYALTYLKVRVEIDDKTMHIVCPFTIRPPKDAKRASILFRTGELDMRLVDKRFKLADLTQYGYVEDLGCSKLDQTNGKPDSKLFPVHEMAFVTNDGKRYHLNAAIFKKAQVEQMVDMIRQATGLEPTGKKSA